MPDGRLTVGTAGTVIAYGSVDLERHHLVGQIDNFPHQDRG
jgi:hypothetical protein